MAARLKTYEQERSEVDAKAKLSHMTILNFAYMYGINLTGKQAKDGTWTSRQDWDIADAAIKLAKKMGCYREKVKHSEFGALLAHDVEVLDEVFYEMGFFAN